MTIMMKMMITNMTKMATMKPDDENIKNKIGDKVGDDDRKKQKRCR